MTQTTLESWAADRPWRDRCLMRTLYVDADKSSYEIGELVGCAHNTVSKWLRRHEIETETNPGVEAAQAAKRKAHASLSVTGHGYEDFKSHNSDGTTDHLKHHRLLAVAEYGFDALCGSAVHHKNGIPWANWPDNIEIMPDSEHRAHHAAERERNRDGTFG